MKTKSTFQNISKVLVVISLLFSSTVSSTDLSAYLYMAQFKSPVDGPYIETYLDIVGNTVKFQNNTDGEFQSKLEILFLFKQNNEIKVFEKYILESPIVTDTSLNYPNFTDVQRIAIENGIYNFELKIKDLYDTTNVFTYKNIVTIDMSADYTFSDIELIESHKKSTKESIINKNGVDLLPYISSFFPTHIDTLTFYAELYSNAKTNDFLLQYYIEDIKSKKALNEFTYSNKINLKRVKPIFTSLNIEDLKTGNYNLVLSLRSKENVELCQKIFFFQRYNDRIIETTDTINIKTYSIAELAGISEIAQMEDYVKSIFPIMNQKQIYRANNALGSKDIDIIKNFFNSFWGSYSNDPEGDWAIYKIQLDRVNLSYSSQIKKGYETDRGSIFLRFGPPNDINRSEHEPSTYPYEIWHYYKIGTETNKKFIFYNPELVGADYHILHSDVRGEKYNPNWQLDLTKRNSSDPNKLQDQYGNRSNQNYNR